jgi:hypothetical protein
LEGHVVAIEPRTAKNHRADAMIDINAGGKKHRYVVEMKRNVDRLAMLGQVKTQLDQFDRPGLLFAPYITPRRYTIRSLMSPTTRRRSICGGKADGWARPSWR